MKMPIDWHEQCVANQKKYLELEAQKLEMLSQRFAEGMLELETYQRQLERAKQQGRESFDRNRFTSRTRA